MKVLLTGCTAPQSSKNTNERNPSFAGIMNMSLTELGFDVTWEDPSVKMSKEYLSQFDSVIVGIAKPTSIVSHRAYGALSVVNHASDLGNLSIFLDTPDLHKINFSLGDVYRKPESLISSFYSKKREYNLAIKPEYFSNIVSGAKKLYTQEWPNTFIPAYPWSNSEFVSNNIPNINKTKLFLVKPDAVLLKIRSSSNTKINYGDHWCVDNLKTEWSKKTIMSLSRPHVSYRESRWESNSDILTRLDGSLGTLISTYKDGNPWWSSSLSQALFVGVPAVTDWRLTSYLGKEWSFLASAVEEMTPEERTVLAENQKNSYMNHLPSSEEMRENIGSILAQKTYVRN